MAKTLEVNFKPNPVQQGFIESRAKADLFASRIGEGKSTALVWSAFQHARLNPGADFVLMRDTLVNLTRTTMKTFFDWFPIGVFGSFNKSERVYTWAEGVASGTVTFIGLDDEKSASKLLSWELGGFGMDEPAPAAGSAGIDEMVFDIAMTRLRQPGMLYYPAKLATNNPDESHWTYKKFSDPGTEGFSLWQPHVPENAQNLPDGYYESVRATLAHRPDLVRRFVEGTFGFQQEGMPVTPQWSDDLHLATGLAPLGNLPLYILWDFGHNPTAIITQKSPMGYWLILDSMVGDGIGVEELIELMVRPTLQERYGRKHQIHHIGDPAGMTGEQTSIYRSAVRALKSSIGGDWRAGPLRTFERTDPLQAVLAKTIGGHGVVQVDRKRAKEVWHALRGGWHYNVARTGTVSTDPKKNMHSHPGDAMGYGAAILFPMGRMDKRLDGLKVPKQPLYFSSQNRQFIGGSDRPPLKHGAVLKA